MCVFVFSEILSYVNTDLTTLVTPVVPNKLKQLLIETEYDPAETEFLYKGFTEGFDIGYRGPTQNIQQTAPNLKLVVGDVTDLWNKVMKEVKEKRFAGPFTTPPFKDFIQSPLGLVAKKGGDGLRLIFHLSYPRLQPQEQQKSVNGNTPQELCSVVYPTIEEAIILCMKMGRSCGMSKSDLKSAFRHLCIKPSQWRWLTMMAISPIDGKKYYFIDKCLPFGAAISCAIFQRFSNALSHILQIKTGRPNVNYLDDYFFVAYCLAICNSDMNFFLKICEQVGFPVSIEKTEEATTLITFLGYLLDSARQMIYIPRSKILQALDLVNKMLGKKKTTLKENQKLCGLLNFFTKCIIPGRAFTRRLYSITAGLTKPHLHADIKSEHRMDLRMWKLFLEHPACFSRPFADFTQVAEDVDIFTDSSRSEKLGCGGISGSSWFSIQWEEDFILKFKPSIAYLELYAVVVAVLNWIHRFQNRKIALFCDNLGVVHMLNNNSSNCKNCMVLIRILVLQGLLNNVKITAKHIVGKSNILSDHLSRLRIDKFRQLTGDKYEAVHTPPPDKIWPMSKIWVI